MAEELLPLPCKIWPPTVLYWPLKPTPAVLSTITVTESDVTLAIPLTLMSSSLNHGPLALTTGVTVSGPPAAVAVAPGVGAGAAAGVGVVLTLEPGVLPL